MLLSITKEVLGKQRKKIQLLVTDEVWICVTRDSNWDNRSSTITEAGLKYRKVNSELSQKEDEGSKRKAD